MVIYFLIILYIIGFAFFWGVFSDDYNEEYLWLVVLWPILVPLYWIYLFGAHVNRKK